MLAFAVCVIMLAAGWAGADLAAHRTRQCVTGLLHSTAYFTSASPLRGLFVAFCAQDVVQGPMAFLLRYHRFPSAQTIFTPHLAGFSRSWTR